MSCQVSQFHTTKIIGWLSGERSSSSPCTHRVLETSRSWFFPMPKIIRSIIRKYLIRRLVGSQPMWLPKTNDAERWVGGGRTMRRSLRTAASSLSVC